MSKRITVLEEWKIADDLYKCPYCDYVSNIKGIGSHVYYKHVSEGVSKIKRITKENGLKRVGKPGHPVNEEVRNKISEGMKKAHQEGRANNWQDSKNKKGNKGSYPEQFMKKVIENEFEDKNYVYSYKVGKYYLDFAWPLKFVYIEIDGSQHEKTISYDTKRDLYLNSLGWIGLRVKWKELYNNPKYFISIMKEFVNNKSILLNNKDKENIDFDLERHVYLSKEKREMQKEDKPKYTLDGFVFQDKNKLVKYIERKKSLQKVSFENMNRGIGKCLSEIWKVSPQKAMKYYHKYFEQK